MGKHRKSPSRQPRHSAKMPHLSPATSLPIAEPTEPRYRRDESGTMRDLYSTERVAWWLTQHDTGEVTA